LKEEKEDRTESKTGQVNQKMGFKKGDTVLILKGKTKDPGIYSFQGTYPITIVPK